MNDSVYGELVAGGVAPSDIGHAPFPGTDGAFLAIVDAFVAARDGDDASGFLSTVASPSAQVAFAAAKGSAQLRNDVDPASLPAYQRSSYQAMNSGAVLLSIAHGELLSPRFQQAMYDGVAAFARTRSAKALADKIQQAAAGAVRAGY